MNNLSKIRVIGALRSWSCHGGKGRVAIDRLDVCDHDLVLRVDARVSLRRVLLRCFAPQLRRLNDAHETFRSSMVWTSVSRAVL